MIVTGLDRAEDQWRMVFDNGVQVEVELAGLTKSERAYHVMKAVRQAAIDAGFKTSAEWLDQQADRLYEMAKKQ